MIPLMIDFSGKKVVIFGGGEVGTRKARYFSPEAEVTICSREFSQDLADLPVHRCACDLEKIDTEQIEALIEDAYLVITALAGQEMNTTIQSICKRKGILCNNAGGEAGDVILPSKISGERYLIAISTFGSSPATARFIREHIEETLPPLDSMISLQEKIRLILKERGGKQADRREVLAAILYDQDIWRALEKSDEEAYELALRRHCR